jgi:diguanylate cyclase (GGDEF)-like protein
MTLRKELFICISMLFVLIFVGTFALSVHNVRNFLVTQLSTEAQNTASSLGISISQHKNADLSTMSVLIDAVFKTGHYQKISIDSLNKKNDLIREHTKSFSTAPTWFTAAIPMNIPEGKALVMQGWKQMGTIYVTSNSGEAYQQLWNNVVDLFWWFLGTLIVTFILAAIALHYLLKPLEAIGIQAEAICARDFSIQNALPRTKELRTVVEAMNKVSQKVHDMFEKQTKITEQLREQAYKDPLTGLGNRRYFNMQVDNQTSSSSERFYGALHLIELTDFVQYKKDQGYEASDLYLTRIAKILNECCEQHTQFIAGRLSDVTFALLTPDVNPELAKKIAIELDSKLNQLHADLKQQTVKHHIGVAMYQEKQSVSDLFSDADMALRAAQSQQGDHWHMYNMKELKKSLIHGAGEWKTHFEKIIKEKSIIMHYQPVIQLTKEVRTILHHEVLLRLPDENGHILSAGIFIPMAENLGIITDLDRLLVEKVGEKIKQLNDPNKMFAINLSPASIRDQAFIQWLYSQLSANPTVAKQMIFEIPEHTAIHELEVLPSIVSQLEKLGSHFSLDHFGRGFSSFKYLRDLKISYVKVDGSYIRNIDKDTGNQFFVHVISQIAHNLDIKVVAENVETELEVTALQNLNIDGMQGYYVGKPSENLL